jgi:hypothetical protein
MARVKFTWGPGNSARKANAKAAHVRIVKFAVARAAEELAMKASAKLAEHHHDGYAKITTSHGSLDWFVNLEDADRGRGSPAAAAIEFGHVTRGGRFVEGIHALTGSLG